MNKSTDKATLAIIEEANTWLVRMQDSDFHSSAERAFSDWLRQSPVHVREYLRAEANWAALAGIDPGRQTNVDELMRAGSSNIVDMTRVTVGRETPEGFRRKHRLITKVAAAAVALLVIFVSYWIVGQPNEVIYKTNRGEQRRVVLDDGSVVEMNTQSEIAVVLSQAARRIELIDGEALFSVATDTNRPFLVKSNDTIVRAVGTQFNVYRRPARLLVTVLEGQVSVEGVPENDGSVAAAESIQLEPGDQLEIVPDAPIQKTEARQVETLAWRDYRLIFDDQTLSNVADEFNRYNNLQIVVGDPELAGQRISAVFDANQPRALIDFLTAGNTIDATFDGDSQVVLSKQRPKQ